MPNIRLVLRRARCFHGACSKLNLSYVRPGIYPSTTPISNTNISQSSSHGRAKNSQNVDHRYAAICLMFLCLHLWVILSKLIRLCFQCSQSTRWSGKLCFRSKDVVTLLGVKYEPYLSVFTSVFLKHRITFQTTHTQLNLAFKNSLNISIQPLKELP